MATNRKFLFVTRIRLKIFKYLVIFSQIFVTNKNFLFVAMNHGYQQEFSVCSHEFVGLSYTLSVQHNLYRCNDHFVHPPLDGGPVSMYVHFHKKLIGKNLVSVTLGLICTVAVHNPICYNDWTITCYADFVMTSNRNQLQLYYV